MSRPSGGGYTAGMAGSQVNWRRLYPFAPHELALAGLRYHYVDEGRGETLLLVHGNPTWSFYWRNLVLALRARYRVIAPDHIGCGLSDKPQEYRYTLTQHVSNLVELLDRLDLTQVTMVGHDWGGAIGIGAALDRPHRVARLVLLNTGAFPPPYVPWRIRLCRVPWLGTFAIRRLNLFARAALRMAVAKPERMTPAVRAGFLAPYDSWANRVAIEAFVRDIPFTRRHPTWRTLARMEQELPRLADRPVQLIWGMRDWCFTAECLQRLLQAFPRADVLRLEDAGHYVVEDAHERIVAALIDFLERHPLQERRSASR